MRRDRDGPTDWDLFPTVFHFEEKPSSNPTQNSVPICPQETSITQVALRPGRKWGVEVLKYWQRIIRSRVSSDIFRSKFNDLSPNGRSRGEIYVTFFTQVYSLIELNPVSSPYLSSNRTLGYYGISRELPQELGGTGMEESRWESGVRVSEKNLKGPINETFLYDK